MHAVMLHGAGGGAWEWNVWRRVFTAAGHRAHCPEFQAVAAGLAATQFEDYLEQAARAAAETGASPVLIGASLGGLLAFALSMRQECAALILVNPLPPAPEAGRLPARVAYPEVIPWGRDASFASTRAALPDAEPATWHFAWRRWRDESGAVLNSARAGMVVAEPRCPVRIIASQADEDVPFALSAELALRLGASLQTEPGSHVGPLLGGRAAGVAQAAVHWLNGLGGFRTD
jgi:pimeloyl-ACP methyl ester carboxylesterase